MRKINIITTIEVEDDAKLEDMIRFLRDEIIEKNVLTFNDYTDFLFTDADTGEEVEDEE